MRYGKMNPRNPEINKAQEIINSMKKGDIIRTKDVARTVIKSGINADDKKLRKDISTYLYNRAKMIGDVKRASSGVIGYVKAAETVAVIVEPKKAKKQKMAKPKVTKPKAIKHKKKVKPIVQKAKVVSAKRKPMEKPVKKVNHYYIVWDKEIIPERVFKKLTGMKGVQLEYCLNTCMFRGKQIFKAKGLDDAKYYVDNMSGEIVSHR